MPIASCAKGGGCAATLKTPLLVYFWLCTFFLMPYALADSSRIKVAMLDPKEGFEELNADHIHKLTDYIQKKFRVARSKAVIIVNESVRHGGKHGLRPEFILAIIAVESSFRERVVSHAGARGLMQIIPRWHPKKIRMIGGAHALFDPRKNITTGTKILVDYLKLSRGNFRKALLRYNGSLSNPRSRYPEKVMKAYTELMQVALS